MTFTNNIELIFIIISLTTTFVDYVVPNSKFLRFKKPFNCAFCLSFWISILLSVCLPGGWVLLTTPLILRIIERRLL